jgi:hypothetical protein
MFLNVTADGKQCYHMTLHDFKWLQLCPPTGLKQEETPKRLGTSARGYDKSLKVSSAVGIAS